MKFALMSLLITLLIGCTATKPNIQYQYKEVASFPPSSYLVECLPPFSSPPKTYGEAALRDEQWLYAFRLCACKIERNRTFYQYKNTYNQCDKLVVKEVETSHE